MVPGVGLSGRVVEVIADRGAGLSPRYRYGSGCVVAGGWVLTAAHVVAGAAAVRIRDRDKAEHAAVLDPDFVGDPSGPGPDLALVEVPGVDLPPMGLARVDRDSPTGDPVERAHVIGYPDFMEQPGPDGGVVRETVDAVGRVVVLSRLVGGLLSVQVSNAPRPLPPGRMALGGSEWSGMSGGPLVADGYLLGVVTEHAPREGANTVTVTPLTGLERDPQHPGWGPGVADPAGWWRRLGIAGQGVLRQLPSRPVRAEPVYRATVREIHSRTEVLVGREKELADITSFAGGGQGYRWLVGGPWTGKTSLLAEAVTATLPPGVDVVSYFLSRREADADSGRFFIAVVPQLAYLLDEEPPAADLHTFRALWQRASDRAATQDRHLLLVVDGLDEDLRPPGLLSVAAALPVRAGGRVHVLVASRAYPELPSDMLVGHPMAGLRPVEVEPFPGAPVLAALARQEIDILISRDDLAVDVFGLLAAAAGPLTAEDLAAIPDTRPRSPERARRIRRLVTEQGARSLQPVGPASARRWQYAHDSLLADARAHPDLTGPDYRDRIHQWAEGWRGAGWSVPGDNREGTPRYLFDVYPASLDQDPRRLCDLVSDPGWVVAAVQTVGADRVLADLRRARAADPDHRGVAAMQAVVVGQARHLRPSQPLDQPGYVLRQLCLQAVELGDEQLAADLRNRLRNTPGLRLLPLWTTRRTSPALWFELGRHSSPVEAMGALGDGRVVTGDRDGQVRMWDPTQPGIDPVDLGRHDGPVRAVAVLPDGRIVTGDGSFDGRALVWDPTRPGADPVELGRHEGPVNATAVLRDGRVVTIGFDRRVLVWDPTVPVPAPPEQLGRPDGKGVAVLPDGRIVTGEGGYFGRVSVWDPSRPRTAPVELGRHEWSEAVAVLSDGRIATSGFDGRVLVWDLDRRRSRPTQLGRRRRRPLRGGRGRDVYGRVSRSGGQGPVGAVAVLHDGRIVTGGGGGSGNEGRVLLWDPARPGTDPVELGRHPEVGAIGELPNGRIVTGGGGFDGRVLVWDPARPGTDPVELGRHDGPVAAVAVLGDSRIASGGLRDGRVRIWDVRTYTEIATVACSVTTEALGPQKSCLVVVHEDARMTYWSSTASSSL